MHEINDKFLEFTATHGVSFSVFTTEAKTLNNHSFNFLFHLVNMFELLAARVSVLGGVSILLLVHITYRLNNYFTVID